MRAAALRALPLTAARTFSRISAPRPHVRRSQPRGQRAGRRSAPRFRRCVGAQPSAGRDVNNRFGRVERALTAGGGQNGRRPDGSEGASCGSGVAGYQR